ncbi:MAG: WYL domain-containing protein [Lachnospiraceae bacterium]|nr:WYL domain-containing protein [Lachnospiraceae bacterium]
MPNTSENKKTKKSESRNNILYLILTLKNHSDRNNPISISKIADHINVDYPEQCGGNINRTTVTRLLDSLEYGCPGLFRDDDITEYSEAGDITDDNNFGFYLRCISDRKTGTRMYYYESVLLESELMTLYDAIETYNYLDVEDIRNISLKLSSLRPLSADRLTYRPSRTDGMLKEDNNVLKSISILSEIIADRNLAEIEYGQYVFDSKTSGFKLEMKEGYPKTLLPLKLIWSNGLYYCICGNSAHENTINLRVDRMIFIKEVPAKPSELKKYSGFNRKNGYTDIESKSMYRSRNPIMYAGEPIHFVLLVNAIGDNMINTMIDVFGINIKGSIITDQEKKKYGLNDNGSKWLKIRVTSSMNGMILFAKEYSGDVIILSPEEGRDRMKDVLSHALNYYSKLS